MAGRSRRAGRRPPRVGAEVRGRWLASRRPARENRLYQEAIDQAHIGRTLAEASADPGGAGADGTGAQGGDRAQGSGRAEV